MVGAPENEPSDGGSLLEAAAVGVVGAAFGAAFGAPFGWTVPVAVIGGANGVIAGWRRIYDWKCSTGALAFVLDSTWAAPMTAAGLASQGLGILRGRPGYDASLSRRANRMVFRRGFVPRRGFAVTVGNVISGAGDTSLPRRRRLVDDHEDVHVWQARWFGPTYPVLYAGWMVLGGAVGMVVWVVRYRSARFAKVVESCAYYLNPFEWWAYSRDGHWPPVGKVAGLGWRRPMVRPRRIS
ncbi:MAG TPA: hypothetical protein VK853_11380 [Ilumatobacteraceae bacterium]|nr:hypothetical protein [Ilumatobacteraceae bacterium]